LTKLIILLAIALGCACPRQEAAHPRNVTMEDVSCMLGCVNVSGEMAKREGDFCYCKFKLVPVKQANPDAGTEQSTQRL